MLNQVDLSRIDLNLLVVLEAVLDERHVGRAAERLNLTSSAVSHSLSRLRRLLDDPVFLRTPKGVVPTARTEKLAEPVLAALAQIRTVVASAGPFDPATSTRRFVVGAPDGVAAVFLHSLVTSLHADAPGIDIGFRQLLPVAGETAPQRAWRSAFEQLDTRELDVAVIPSDDVPARFSTQALYVEDFVLGTRADHPFMHTPTLAAYCEAAHLVVSLSGDPHGFVDDVLARQGLQRRVALTVPNFMFACAILADTDLICAFPNKFLTVYGSRMGVWATEPPVPFGSFHLNAVTPKAASADAGLNWMLELVGRAVNKDHGR